MATPLETPSPPSVPPSSPDDESPPPSASSFQRFFSTYSTFLSSFVIGAAGLIATTLYQTQQQEITRRQGEAQIKISELNAENQWRIERAEILAKNLAILSSNREDNVEPRYGVLLSLTRGKILDSELAVSYALELGSHNAEYMRSVLANVGDKNWEQIDHAYVVGCDERYGARRTLLLCQNDRFVHRSRALAELVSDELNLGNRAPLSLLADEQKVQLALRRRVGLFSAYLTDLYERRQLDDIERFEQLSAGAHLVAALVLSTSRDDSLISDDEMAERARFYETQQRWLESYLLDRRCDPQCKGRLADLMFTDLGYGAHAHALEALFERPDNESTHAHSRLHQRLLWCRASDAAIATLRDRVLVPVATRGLDHPSPAASERIKDVFSLLALVPLPSSTAERQAWYDLLEAVRTKRPPLWRDYLRRRDAAERQREAPTPAQAQGNFCGAAAAQPLNFGEEE